MGIYRPKNKNIRELICNKYLICDACGRDTDDGKRCDCCHDVTGQCRQCSQPATMTWYGEPTCETCYSHGTGWMYDRTNPARRVN